MKLRSWFVVLAAVLVGFSAAGRAQTLSWQDCPAVYCADMQAAKNYFSQSKTRPFRILIIGDSQETCPEGRGESDVPRFNADLARLYFGGNSPETPIQLSNFVSQIALPQFGQEAASAWLTVSAQGAPGPQAPSVAGSFFPPNIYVPGGTFKVGRYGTANANAGNLVLLQPNAESVYAGVVPSIGHPYFDISQGTKLQIFATTQSASGDVAWFAKPNNTGAPSYNSTTTQSGTLGLSLSSPTFSVVSGTTPVLNFNGNNYMQVELLGTDDAHPTQIIGSRYSSVANPVGIVATSFSSGGYQTTHFLLNHSNCAEVLRAMEFDAVMLCYGANESGIVTPAQFKANQQTVISWFTTNVSSNLYFILAGDPYNGYDGPSPNNFDFFPGVQYEIAQSNTHVITFNIRLQTGRLSPPWDEAPVGDPYLYMFDLVHYTRFGGINVGAFWAGDVGIILNYCYANCDGSTTPPILTANDFQCFLNAYAAGDSYANCDGTSGIVPTLTANDFQCFLNAFAAGCS